MTIRKQVNNKMKAITKREAKQANQVKKIPGGSKKQNLNLLCTGNSLHSMYIVLGISNLEMMCVGYMQIQ